MPTLDLRAIYLNAAAHPEDLMAFEWVGESLSYGTSDRGEVRQNLGRRRIVRRGAGGRAESLTVTLPRCTASEVAWLREHTGVLLCVRDHVGTKFYGVYFAAPRELQTRFVDRTEVKIQIDEVTHSEAV